jgi:hypothetical protein
MKSLSLKAALRRADHPFKESYRLWMIKKLREISPMLQSGRKKEGLNAIKYVNLKIYICLGLYYHKGKYSKINN